MGKKVALLIGVSEYQTENNLPPCQKDMKLMHAIVSGSEKYDDVLVLDNSPKSSEAKDKISGFIRKNQSQDIEEVFVYYTGHGARNGDDFLYLFSDFNRRA
ncbi:MAG: caspase family protein [Porticoccaceae bacterium]|nr:caspase family protein [Porticoccaceae bacterium]